MNIDNHCNHPEYQEKLCWIAVLDDPRAGINEFHNTDDIQDDLTICYECDKLKIMMERGFGRRTADQTVITTILKLIKQLSIKKQNLQQTADQLKYSLEQLSLLNSITDALARSDNLEKSLKIILTGATSGDAFGFNRAAVFLLNENNDMLEGKSAIGPENLDEAFRIWENISKIPLIRLLEEIIIENEFVPCSLETRVSRVRISQQNQENLFIKILDEAKEKVIDIESIKNSNFDFSWWPPVEKIVAVPLISEGRPLGLIIADNTISNKEITDDSVDSLKSLANACAPGLQNAILHAKLHAQLKELERVYELFQSNQAYLVRHERLADIGTLATKVAHEFRIPLVTIGGYARRIYKTVGSDKFDKNMVKVIIDEVDRLTKISSSILEYSRSPKLNIRECDLNSIVNESLSQLNDKLDSSGIDTEKLFAGKNLKVSIDPERLKQVVLNLVDNAVDAMEKGGKLSIKTSKSNEYVTIDIQDTGSGIDEFGLENLFNLFYTTKDKGSGLGLPVSKKIIDDHGGYINVKSIPGKGTVFSVRIPASYNYGETNKALEK